MSAMALSGFCQIRAASARAAPHADFQRLEIHRLRDRATQERLQLRSYSDLEVCIQRRFLA
jgi:hypothetical protein